MKMASLEKAPRTRSSPQIPDSPFFRRVSRGEFFPPSIWTIALKPDLAPLMKARTEQRAQRNRMRRAGTEPAGAPPGRMPAQQVVTTPAIPAQLVTDSRMVRMQRAPGIQGAAGAASAPSAGQAEPGTEPAPAAGTTGEAAPGPKAVASGAEAPVTAAAPAGKVVGARKPGEPGEEAAVPRAPRKPDEDKQFQSVKGSVKRSARQQRHHEKTDIKVQQAKDASALDEASQKQEDAKIRRTGELENTGAEQKRTYRFDAEKFKTELLKRLRSVLPKDEDQAKEFPKSNKLEGVKAEVSGSVAREKEAAVGRMDDLITPDPPGGKAEKPDDVKVPDPVPGAHPPQIDPKLAVPKPKTNQEISLQHESDKLDTLMTDNNLSRDQLADSNEPKFIHALKFKEETQRKVAEAPARYRAQEQPQLETAAAQAGEHLHKGLGAMRGRKSGATGRVFKQQGTTENKTEKRQKEIKGFIDGNYSRTLDDVTKILKSLADAVREGFSMALENQTNIFNMIVRARLDDYYGDWRIDDELFGPVAIVKDPETGEVKFINPDVYAIFVEEKNRYLEAVGGILDLTAQLVADGLNRASARLQQGRQAQDEFKRTLKGDELDYANTLTGQVDLQFAALESSINDTQEELLTSLAEQYNESVKNLEKSFNEINDELKKSWLDRAAEFIKTVGKTIYELADLLLSILTRIANIVWDIIKHPIRFFETLVRGLLQGVGDFIDNITTYLEEAFWTWVTGATSAAGIHLGPGSGVEKLFGLVVQVLNLSAEDLRKIAERIFGKEVVALVDKGISAVERVVAGAQKLLEPAVILMTKGVGALWSWLKESLGGLVESAFAKIKETVFFEFVTRGLKWIAGFFVPGGGFVKVVKALFAAVSFLVDNMENIRAIFDAILGSFEQAIRGDTSGVAARVIKGLKIGVVLALDFLAKILGIDKILAKVRKFFHDLRTPLLKAIEWVMRQVRNALEKIGFFTLLRKAEEVVRKGTAVVVKKVAAVKARIVDWWRARKTLKTQDGQEHLLHFSGAPEAARLMIQTTPQLYSTFVSRLPDNPDKKQLEKLAADIDMWLAMYPRLRQDQMDDWAAVLIDHLNQVAALTEKYAFAQAGAPNTVVTWDPPTREGFGVGFHAKLLSRNYVKGQEAEEEKKAVYGWDIARSRKAISARGNETSVYVRGHLLNAQLGGRADPTNLTPITIAANNEHKTKVENKVKAIVLTPSTAPGEGVANYEVQALYHVHPNRADLKDRFYRRVARIDKDLIDLERSTLPDKDTRIGRLKQDRDDLVELVLLLTYEEHELATALLCKWQKMTWDSATKAWVAGGPVLVESVENTLPADIEQYKFMVRQFAPEPL